MLRFAPLLLLFIANIVVAATSASGSGFVVSADGYVVTNNHVIAGSKLIKVRLPGGGSYEAKVVRKDPSNDLVVLKIDAKNLSFLTIENSTEIKRGEKVYAIGYPQSEIQGNEPKLTDGMISSLSGIRDEPTSFQISNPIQPGNSGGPLFTEEGKVIGVVVATLDAIAVAKKTGSIPQNVNYAIKSIYLSELLRTIDENIFAPQKKKMFDFSKTKKFVDIVKAVEKSVVMIEVELSEPPAAKQTQPPPPNEGRSSATPKAESPPSLYKDKTLASLEDCKSILPGLKKTYPQRVDSVTTLVDAGCTTYKNRVTLGYQYVIDNVASDINRDALKARESSIRRDICNNKSTRELLNYVDIWYYYTDKNGADLYLIAIQKSQCK